MQKQRSITHFQTMYHMSEKNRKLPRYRQVNPAKSCHTCMQRIQRSACPCGHSGGEMFLEMSSTVFVDV